MQAYNDIASKYNELQIDSELMKSENSHLTKKIKEDEAIISVREVVLKKVERKVEYYEEKSSSIEIFMTVKVCVEMINEFTEGKSYSWNPEAEFKS